MKRQVSQERDSRSPMNQQSLSALIWWVADLLGGDYSNSNTAR